MQATEINDIAISKIHCDYIVENAKELKALFAYNSETMIKNNKIRALCDIESIKNSLAELELYIQST